MTDIEEPEVPHRPLHWSIRLVAGLFFALGGLVGLVGSGILVFDPQTSNPAVAIFGGIVMALLSIWILAVAIRLLFNKPNHGGLLSPLTLRLVAVYMAAMPTFLIVTGRSSSWTFLQYLQAAMFVFGATGLWRLAAWRKASNIRA